MRYISNPPNPYLKYSAEFLGEPPIAKLEIFEGTATKKSLRKTIRPMLDLTFRSIAIAAVSMPAHIVLRVLTTNF